MNSGGTPIDDDLALLIDLAKPDRNRNGICSYTDVNHNGRYMRLTDGALPHPRPAMANVRPNAFPLKAVS